MGRPSKKKSLNLHIKRTKYKQKAGTFKKEGSNIISDQYISLFDTETDQIIEVRPYPLNASTLQFLSDNKKIKFINNNVLIENNNLVINTSKKTKQKKLHTDK